MKRLTCKDIGSKGCSFVAMAETEDEVKKVIFSHAEQHHPEIMDRITEREKAAINTLMDKILAKG